MPRRHRLLFLVAAVLAFPAAAGADVLGSRQNQPGHITRIGKGVFQLGVDAIFTSSYQKEEDESVFRANLIGRGHLRYLVRDNLAVGLHAGVLYRKTGDDQTDLALIGDVSLRWYARLGEGMFWAPEGSLGLLFGSRDIDTGTAMSLDLGLVGFAAGLKLPLVFCSASRRAPSSSSPSAARPPRAPTTAPRSPRSTAASTSG